MPGTKPKYIVSADIDTTPEIPDDCEWISENNGWLFFNDKTHIITEENNLSWSYFSSSLAVNFAILRDYKEIYLAGIDLVEDGKQLFHYDGVATPEAISPFRCREDKQFIKDICKNYGIKIYNLNPACDWLEVKDIGLLK